MSIRFQDTYRNLGTPFFAEHPATPVKKPGLIKINPDLATLLGIDADWLTSENGINVFAGNDIPEGATPIATKYGGHQFGNWNPQLGDGRAVLLGEVIGTDGQRYDVQLKGSGPTPYSRGGDGRSPVGPVLREYIVSEAMFALGVPTTRALAAVTTGEVVRRTEPLPGAVFTRVAKSHIRVGTFEFFSGLEDVAKFRTLVDYVIDRHYPACADDENPPAALLRAVLENQASLIAHWQSLGFIHGVMNTDNALVSGETIDYGPCAFMDDFEIGKVFSSIDRHGRYAYNNQPLMGHWNVTQFASALIPVLADDRDAAIEIAQSTVNTFPDVFSKHFSKRINLKLGLLTETDEDDDLMTGLFSIMEKTGSDFTLTFRTLSDLAAAEPEHPVDYTLPVGFEDWLPVWRERCQQESTTAQERQQQMYKTNPAFIARNHQVEAAIVAGEQGDFEPFHALVDVLNSPFEYNEKKALYAVPPLPEEIVHATFCGT